MKPCRTDIQILFMPRQDLRIYADNFKIWRKITGDVRDKLAKKIFQ